MRSFAIRRAIRSAVVFVVSVALVATLMMVPAPDKEANYGLFGRLLASVASALHLGAGKAVADSANYQSMVLADGPAAYYRLGESSGTTAADSSGNGRNGTYGSLALTLGTAGAIAGNSDTSVNAWDVAFTAPIAGMPTGSSARTFETWIKPTASESLGTELARWGSSDQFRITIGSYGDIGVQSGANSVSFWGPIDIRNNHWHHVAVTYDGTNVRGYLDGRLTGVAALAVNTGTGAGLSVGDRDGYFDEVAIYPTALSASKINAHWTKGNSARFECAPSPSSTYSVIVNADLPSHYYRLGDLAEDASSRVAFDSSRNCRNGVYGTTATSVTGTIAGDSNTAADSTETLIAGPASGLPTGSSARTFETWIKATADEAWGVDLIRWGLSTPFQVTIGSYGDLHVYSGSNSAHFTGPGDIRGAWHHVAITYDGTTVWGYVDGTPVGSAALAVNTSADYGFVVGGRDGNYDDLAIYPRALPADHIKLHYLLGGNNGLIGGNVSLRELLANGNFCFACAIDGAFSEVQQGNYVDPVNTAFGTLVETRGDLVIKGRGPALAVMRTYNSGVASEDGPYGYGWKANANARLSINGTTGNITVIQEDGSEVPFIKTGSTYAPAAPRFIATLVKNGDNTYTLVRNNVDTLNFDTSGLLVSQKDLNNLTTTFAYSSGKLASATNTEGRSITWTWSGSRISSVSDSAGRSVAYGYDGSGNLTTVTYADGAIETYGYDSSHRMTTILDPNQYGSATPQRVTNVYDTSGRVHTQTDQLGHTTTFDYNGDGSVVITDAVGNQIKEYYKNNLRVAVTTGYNTAAATTVRMAYDPVTAGLVASYVEAPGDPNTYPTTTTYDSSGRVVSATDALGRTSSFTYDAKGNVLTATGPNPSSVGPSQVTTTNTYNTAGNLLTTTSPLYTSPTAYTNQTTTYQYNISGKSDLVSAVINPLTKTTAMTYDTIGQLASVTTPGGRKTTFTYDSLGRVLTSVAPKGNVSGATAANFTTTYTYDAAGRVLTQSVANNTAPDVTTYTYDKNGNVKTVKDANNHTTTYAYDLANRSTTVTDPNSIVTQTTYFNNNVVATQVDGRNATARTFTQDSLGRVASAKDGLNRTTTYAYGGMGQALSVVQPGALTTTNTYDNTGALTGVNYSDGTTPNVTYVYNAAGLRASMTDGTGTTTYSYDSLGRLTSTTNGAGKTVGYQYDLANQQTKITYPGSHDVTQVFGDDGEITSISDWLTHTNTFTYDQNANELTRAMANNVTATSTYDNANRLASVTHTISGWNLAGFTATRSTIGAVTDTGTTGYYTAKDGSHSYNYDNGDRLTTADGGTLAYDNAHRPTTVVGGVTQTFDAADQLATSTRAGGTTFGFDSRGNRTTITPTTGYTTTLGYNQANLLKSANSTASTPVSYNSAVNADSPGAYYRLSDPPQDNFFATNGLYYGFLSGSAVRRAPGGLRGDADTALNFYNGTGEGWLTSTPSNTTAGGDTTVEFLMRWDGSTTTTEVPFAFENDYMLAIKNGNIGFSTKSDVSDLYGKSATGLGNRWVHVVAVFRNGSVTGSKLYIDGVLQTLTQLSGTPVTSPTATSAASISGTDAGVFHINGGMDELAIYSSALSATRVSAHYASSQNYTATYTYDGDGLRASKTSGGTTASFVWDHTADNALLLSDGSFYYVYGPDGLPLMQINVTDDATQWYGHDTLGDTRLLVDAAANMSATFSYDAYGNVTASGGRVDTPLRYRGEYQDKETGFTYLRARYYDAQTAQFLTRDPIVAATRDAYGYTGGDPLNNVDPSGFAKEKAPNWKKLNDAYLKKLGIDAHEVKREFKAGSGDADLFEDKNTGKVYVRDKQGKSEPVDTGITIGSKQQFSSPGCSSEALASLHGGFPDRTYVVPKNPPAPAPVVIQPAPRQSANPATSKGWGFVNVAVTLVSIAGGIALSLTGRPSSGGFELA